MDKKKYENMTTAEKMDFLYESLEHLTDRLNSMGKGGIEEKVGGLGDRKSSETKRDYELEKEWMELDLERLKIETELMRLRYERENRRKSHIVRVRPSCIDLYEEDDSLITYDDGSGL